MKQFIFSLWCSILFFNLQAQESSLIHSVVEGETVKQLSDAYQVPIDSIVAWNGLINKKIYPDQKLRIVNLKGLMPSEVTIFFVEMDLEALETAKKNNDLWLIKYEDGLKFKHRGLDADDPTDFKIISHDSKQKKVKRDSIAALNKPMELDIAAHKKEIRALKIKVVEERKRYQDLAKEAKQTLVEDKKNKTNEAKALKTKEPKLVKEKEPKPEKPSRDKTPNEKVEKPKVEKEPKPFKEKPIKEPREKVEKTKETKEKVVKEPKAIASKPEKDSKQKLVKEEKDKDKEKKAKKVKVEKAPKSDRANKKKPLYFEEDGMEVLVFDDDTTRIKGYDLDLEVDVTDVENSKLERKNQKLIAKMLKEGKDTADFAMNVGVDEVEVVEKKSKKKPKIGDEVDEIRSEKSRFFLTRAKTEIDKQDYKKANEYIDKSISLNPSYSDAYILKGDLYASFGNYTEAIAQYNNAIKLNKADARLHYNIGSCLMRINQNKEAIIAMSKSLELDDQYVLAYSGRSALYINLKMYEEAVADYTTILSINKYFYPALTGRGVAYLENGDYDEAIRDFNQALEYEPDDAFVYYKRGIAKLYNNKVYNGCLDLLKSDELGYEGGEKAIKKYCN